MVSFIGNFQENYSIELFTLVFIDKMLMKTFSFIKRLLLRTILENTYVVLEMRKKSNLTLFKVNK
jgi:hypothetical protein